ncbi:hypothetical protein QR685DRAFT_366788 [Neurospora intermedia]|uniref:Secreted protein n=1 Tax=Neurospora intermedia TaxID=5142 RepID=A0ABR3D4S3_NEUIN
MYIISISVVHLAIFFAARSLCLLYCPHLHHTTSAVPLYNLFDESEPIRSGLAMTKARKSPTHKWYTTKRRKAKTITWVSNKAVKISPTVIFLEMF